MPDGVSRHKRASGYEHALELAQRRHPVAQVVQNERADRDIEGSVREKSQRLCQVSDMKRGVRQPSFFGDIDHLRADVEADDARPVLDKPLRQRAGAAADVQNTLPANVSEQVNDGRALIQSVVRRSLAPSRVRARDSVVSGSSG